MNSFATLRSLVRKPQARERCELCGSAIAHEHPHLFNPTSHQLVCACQACSLLFWEHGETKYKRVPRRVRFLRDFLISDGQWDSLLIPIGLAFFVKRSIEDRVVALYPSPAGPTESLLPLETWMDLVAENPVLETMEADVEALLANRLDRTGEYFLTPIDKCYELVGLIRGSWRGLSGGTEVWERIRTFFTELKEGAPVPDLTFTVEGAEAIPFAASPLLALKMRVRNADPEEAIHTIVLRAQIQIEATRRRYNDREKENLQDLFGEPDRWSRTLRSMLWTHANAVVQSFTDTAVTELQIPCTFDFNVAATKYFHGVSEGDIR